MPTDHDTHSEPALSGTTRELNFSLISFVTVLFVLLLIITITGATGWFRWEFNNAAARQADKQGLNSDLVRLQDEQRAHFDDKIESAMSAVAEQH